jgi:aspartate/methionine/tyrosine aminotransferase
MAREINPLTQCVIPLTLSIHRLFSYVATPNRVLTTVGATEAIYLCMQAFLSAGDECIIFDPAYDSYGPSALMAGAKPVSVPLRVKGKSVSSSDWVLDRDELVSKITSKTKMILINNPMNVPGKVWSRSDLEFIAEVAQKRDLLVVCDEVYEWITYDGKEHLKLATFPQMWDRTLTIGSAGKSFSLTGFKIGWIIGSEPLIDALSCAHQNTVFSVGTPLQEGIAVALEQSESRNYFPELRSMFTKKRDALCQVLKDAGLQPTVPEGSYFILADTSIVKDSLFMDSNDSSSRDFQFCRWLTKHIGVVRNSHFPPLLLFALSLFPAQAAIPPSAFFSAPYKNLAANYARFAFCKQDKSFTAAQERLKKLGLKPIP